MPGHPNVHGEVKINLSYFVIPLYLGTQTWNPAQNWPLPSLFALFLPSCAPVRHALVYRN